MLSDFQNTGESSNTKAWQEKQCEPSYDSEYQMGKIRERFGDIQLICKEEPSTDSKTENALGLTYGNLKSSRFFPENSLWSSNSSGIDIGLGSSLIINNSGSIGGGGGDGDGGSGSSHGSMAAPTTVSSKLSDASLFYATGPLPSNAIKIPPPGFQPITRAPIPTLQLSHSHSHAPHSRSFSGPTSMAAKGQASDASVFQPVLQTQMLLSKAVLKMTNIPWEISTSDVLSFFREYSIPSDGVYIPIDRSSGKTKNEVYIEFNYFPELLDALARKHRQIIKSREVFLNRSSWEEVLRAHFPKARLDLNEYITSEEISAIATICRYYKIHFSRKCAERPFEHVMSLMKLLPWPTLTESSRDQCFELLQMSVEALMGHVSRPNSHIDHALLIRLIDAGLQYAHTLRPAQLAYLVQTREQSTAMIMQLHAQTLISASQPMTATQTSPVPTGQDSANAGSQSEKEVIMSLTSRVHELERLLEVERLANEAKTTESTF